MEKISFKKHIITSLLESLKIEPYANRDLIVFTSGGVITGGLIELSGNSADNLYYPVSCFADKSILDYYEQNNISPDVLLSGDDGYIVLSNATFEHGSSKTLFNEILIFFDKILGISLGNPR
jgi:hypothetical protein